MRAAAVAEKGLAGPEAGSQAGPHQLGGAGRRAWRALREETAQAAIEMALSLPLFLLVIFGMFQCSVVLQKYCNASYACRNAARYASLHSSTSLAPSTYSDIVTMAQSGMFLNAGITPTITVNYFTASSVVSGSGGACTGTPNSSLNVVGNVVCVQASWTQSVPFTPASSYTISTRTYKIISR